MRKKVLKDIIIKDTHRGLLYEDGVLKQVLGAGYYEIEVEFPQKPKPLFGKAPEPPRQPTREVILVDMRERDLTIKGQEILTSDKVAIRVSIVVQFRVIDPTAAKHAVEDYETRLYTDVQLAARRSLASMTLEDILTNRNRLSEDILGEVKEVAATYGVQIGRADVKDLVFPGNLQDIMNKVLAAERLSQVQLVEARTKTEIQRLEAQTQAENQRIRDQATQTAKREAALLEAETEQIRIQAEVQTLREQEATAQIYSDHPALLRMMELEALQELAKNANARIFINFEGIKSELDTPV